MCGGGGVFEAGNVALLRVKRADMKARGTGRVQLAVHLII